MMLTPGSIPRTGTPSRHPWPLQGCRRGRRTIAARTSDWRRGSERPSATAAAAATGLVATSPPCAPTSRGRAPSPSPPAAASSSGTSRNTIGRSSSAYSLTTDEASLISRSATKRLGTTSGPRTSLRCSCSSGARRSNQSILCLGWSCGLTSRSYSPVADSKRIRSSPMVSSELRFAPGRRIQNDRAFAGEPVRAEDRVPVERAVEQAIRLWEADLDARRPAGRRTQTRGSGASCRARGRSTGRSRCSPRGPPCCGTTCRGRSRCCARSCGARSASCSRRTARRSPCP